MSRIFELKKEKIKGLVILLIGLIIPVVVKFIIMLCFARAMGPEKFGSFLDFWNTNILFNIILMIIYIVWLYLIVSVVANINTKKTKMNKKAALEMSIGTIVIIVIAITMLILGIVFVRSVMCGAIGLTGELNSRVTGEINKLFGSTGGEVQCLGVGSEPVKMIPGQTNIIWCGIKAPQTAKYTIILNEYSGGSGLTESETTSWIETDSWTGTVVPGDEDPKKAIRLNIPDNAPEASLYLQVVIKKEGNIISTQDLDFEISRVGLFKAAMC